MILKHDINVFINRQLIYNYPEQLFSDAGVMAIEHADFDGIERLALVTGLRFRHLTYRMIVIAHTLLRLVSLDKTGLPQGREFENVIFMALKVLQFWSLVWKNHICIDKPIVFVASTLNG